MLPLPALAHDSLTRTATYPCTAVLSLQLLRLTLLLLRHLTHLHTCLNSSRTSTGLGVLAPTLPSSSVTATCTRCSGISGASCDTSSRLKPDRNSCKMIRKAATGRLQAVRGACAGLGTQQKQRQCHADFVQHKSSRTSCKVPTHMIRVGSLFYRAHAAHASTMAGCSITNCWSTITLQPIAG